MPKLNIPVHKIKLSELINSIPDGNIDKLFVQCELTGVKADQAEFSVSVYVADKEEKKWKIGKRVMGVASEAKYFDLTHPVGFANTEVIFRFGKKKFSVEHEFKAKHLEKPKSNPFAVLWERLTGDEKLLAKTELSFIPRISDNPHITFDVLLDTGDRQIQLTANPSPPAPPIDEAILQ